MKILKIAIAVCAVHLTFMTNIAAQQAFFVRNGCAVDDTEMGQNHYIFDASPEAKQIIQTIMDANFLQPNFIVKSADCDNALATFENGNRYILYSTSYVERIKNSAKTDWAAYFVFAHEIGHHLSNHRFDLTNEQLRKQQELQADIFAGGMLFRLGAGLEEAQAGVSVVCKEKESTTHPARRARLEAVASGWKKAKDQNGGVQPKAISFTIKSEFVPFSKLNAIPSKCYESNIPCDCNNYEITADKYELVTERVLIRPESREGAIWQERIERYIVSPASIKWVKKNATSCSNNLVMCLVEVPAEVKHVKKFIKTQEGRSNIIKQAEYVTITKRILLKEGVATSQCGCNITGWRVLECNKN